jgi:hypothetical protein
MTFMKFYHMTRDLFPTRLSEFHTDRVTFVPEELQGCSQMNTTRSKINSCGLTADFCDEGIVKTVQSLNKCLNPNEDCGTELANSDELSTTREPTSCAATRQFSNILQNPKSSLPRIEELSNCPYPEPYQFSPRSPIIFLQYRS